MNLGEKKKKKKLKNWATNEEGRGDKIPRGQCPQQTYLQRPSSTN
jgi:hypothetical protein